MKELTISEMRAVQLEMLDRLDKVCREHGLRYYLCGGTLLGAVRHKGYIPWDDDIDVNILRPDLDRLLEITGGKLDILVNCAGIQRRHELEEFPIEDWDEVIEVNLTSCFELCQLAGRIMLKQGKGKIINLASMISFFGGIRIPAYAASKGGIAQLTKSLAVGWADKGIQVNALAPGYMATDMNTALLEDPVRSSSILSRIPAGRWGVPEDMAGPCVFLASDASDYVNGAVIPVDGAYLVM